MGEQKALKIFIKILFVVLFISLAIYIPYEYFYNSKIYNLKLNLGDRYVLSLMNSDLTYVSSNPNIATVDENGVIDVINFGEVKVTVKDKNNKMKYRYDITIKDSDIASLELTPTQLELKTGDSYQLIHRYISKNVPESITWVSSNPSVVSVDENGIVKGLKEGKSVVKVIIDTYEAECVVNVSKVNNKVEPNYVVTTKPSTTTTTTKPTTTTTTKPSTNTQTTTKPSTSTNTQTTTTPSTNTPTTTKPSTSTTTKPTTNTDVVKPVEEKTPQAVITTNKPVENKEPEVESISSDITSKSIFVNETYQINTVIRPSGAKTTLSYKSNNTNVATVSDKGLVTGKGKGTAIITVSGSGKSYNVTITVNEIVVIPTKKTINVTYSANGASLSKTTDSCTTTFSSCSVTLPSFTREGYSIIGYSTNPNATTAEYKIGDSVNVSVDTTFYAITGRTITATFSPTSYVSSTSASCTMYNTSTSCTIKTPNISRPNYASLGFNTNSNAGSGSIGANANANISGNITYYAITRINQDGIIAGCTGWAAGNIKYYSSPSSGAEGTLSSGTAFTIEGIDGRFFKVTIPGKSGYKYVLHDYVMINLPDYIPSIIYNITNSYSAIYRTSGMDIPGITGTKLYSTGQVYNIRLRRNEYMAPMIYSTANLVLAAQNKFKANGYSLKIYDTYRPASVSNKVSNALNSLYKSNKTVKDNIDYSYGLSGTRYTWGPQYFIASSGSRHNLGVALDTTLAKGGVEVQMPTAMHELSTKAIKYYSGSVAKVPANYAKEMNDSAKYLDSVMTSVGLNTISGEWWHFQENAATSRTTTYDFQVTGIYSY